jgi:hypothetical protein
MLDLVGLSDHQVLDVRTQVATGQGLCTTDMCVRLQGPSGRRAELRSEHKVESPFGRDQLNNYKRALAKRRNAGQLAHFQVVVQTAPSAVEQEQLSEMGAHILTWSNVADAVEEVQTRRARDWYAAARRPSAMGQLRALAEFAVVLEDYLGVAVSGPLDNEKVAALQNIERARDVAQALLERVADQLTPGSSHEGDDGEPDEKWLAIPVIGWWNGFEGGTLYLWVAPNRWFEEPPDPVPSFGVSVEVGKDAGEVLREDTEFMQTLEGNALRVGTYEATGTLHIGDSAELASVADRATLTEQAEELALFARDTVVRLAGCPPAGADTRAIPEEDSLIALDPDTPK